MDTIRVSATDIDALRRYREDEDADFAGLLAQLRHEQPPTEAMLAGTALHAALEAAAFGEHATLSAYGYTFALDIEDDVDLPAIREMKATREYRFGECIVTLVGKVDAVHGLRVDDHKFTASYDAERFLGSYQWRIYLEIFGADEFRWNVFEGRETGPNSYSIRHMHKLRMHRYPGMADDVQQEVAAFVEFARDHLPERFKRAG